VGGTLFTFNLYQDYDNHPSAIPASITQDGRAIWGADGLDTSGAWTVLNPLTAVATNGPTLAIQADASILASGTLPSSTVYTVTAWTNLTAITGIRLETLTNASLPGGGPRPERERQLRSDRDHRQRRGLKWSSVPEPGTLGTLAIALGGFAGSDAQAIGAIKRSALCGRLALLAFGLVSAAGDRELPLQARLNRLAEAVNSRRTAKGSRQILAC